MDGWMVDWMDGWMDGWTDGQKTETESFVPAGGGSSAGVLAGAWAPGGMWMLLKLVVGGPDAPDPGPGVKPIPGAGPGPKLWFSSW